MQNKINFICRVLDDTPLSLRDRTEVNDGLKSLVDAYNKAEAKVKELEKKIETLIKAKQEDATTD